MIFKQLIIIFFAFQVGLAKNSSSHLKDNFALDQDDENTYTLASDISRDVSTVKPDVNFSHVSSAAVNAASTSGRYYYNVTKNNVTCIMVDGSLSFKIVYDSGSNRTNETIIHVPEPSNKTQVKGSCGNNSQYIQIYWDLKNSVKMTFSLTNDSKAWLISDVTSGIFFDDENFLNATESGQSVENKVNLDLSPSEFPVEHSFMCFATRTFSNVTSSLNGTDYEYPVTFTMNGVQIEAFNTKQHKGFLEAVHCSADNIADIVPIAVGVALAILVAVVLGAYLFARRRRASSYQSV